MRIKSLERLGPGIPKRGKRKKDKPTIIKDIKRRTHQKGKRSPGEDYERCLGTV